MARRKKNTNPEPPTLDAASGLAAAVSGSKGEAGKIFMSLTDKMASTQSESAKDKTPSSVPPPIPAGEAVNAAKHGRLDRSGDDNNSMLSGGADKSKDSKSVVNGGASKALNGAGGSTEPAAISPASNGDDVEAFETAARRAARRRPAGPVRERIAANDDAPSIGGLIYALQQKPSGAPLKYASIASLVWGVVGLGYAALALWSEFESGVTIAQLLLKPVVFLSFTAIVIPIAVIWFLAVLAWRAEELRLRSSTMTEVAVRLAEPDRLAEQSVASLGQAVRQQVSFMNDAVSRALGRAGELEAMVHNEVASLEASYEENERKIRGLIDELAHERSALAGTGGDFADTLRAMSEDVPALIERLTGQQSKLAGIIASAGDNLTTLETSLGSRTEHLEEVLGSYSGAIDTALTARTQQIHGVLEDHATKLDAAFDSQADKMHGVLGNYTTALADALGTRTAQIESTFSERTSALTDALDERAKSVETAFEERMSSLDSTIGQRTDNLQAVFEEYALALDSTLANRAEAMDTRLIERTRALDDAFNQRLEIFDESVRRSTEAIDMAVGEKANALTSALESHATTFRETITQQAADLDESLVHGISAVRRSSENISRQSLKAIEGLAGQSDLLRNVSENLLGQINSVTNRFDSQTQSIMSAANALESANSKVDSTLRTRHTELSSTLDRLAGTAEEFGRFVEGYSTSIEGSLHDAEQRARSAALELRSEAETQQRAVLEDFDRFRDNADQKSSKVLEDMRQRFVTVQDELTSQLGSMSQKVEGSTDDLRQKVAAAANAIEQEQARLHSELAAIPAATREGTESMRRALQDQLKALERLSQISNLHAKEQDVRMPISGYGGRGPDGLGVSVQQHGSANSPNVGGATRGLSSLSTSVARELAARSSTRSAGGSPTREMMRAAQPSPLQERGRGLPSPQNGPQVQNRVNSGGVPRAGASSAQVPQRSDGTSGGPRAQPRDRWSLGDLLERASFDEAGGDGPEAQASGRDTASPAATTAADRANARFDLNQLARAIDPRSAAQIWERLRKGENGFLTREMYEPEGRIVFDDLSHRVKADAGLKQMADAVMDEFEKSLRDGAIAQASSDQILARLTSDAGRIYVFLAHVTGRIK